MRTDAALRYLGVWGGIGCVLFSAFVLIAFRTGLVHTARRSDGTLKERVPIEGVLAMMIIPVGILALHLIANYFGLARRGVRLSYGRLYLLNLLTYVIFFAYDTLVIDGLVLGLWRPEFLHLPDEMGRESMGRHMLISIPIGMVIGALLTLVTTGVSFAILFQD